MTQKKPYTPPHLRTIDLAADEVLSAGCKLSVGGMASGGNPCTLNFCSNAGT